MSSFLRTFFGCGFGGQGVMVLGQLLSYAGIEEDRQVTWLPSYGPEMRGGTAHCSVIISDTAISSPFVTHADLDVALNQPSVDKYFSFVKPGGVLLYNSDMAICHGDPKDAHVFAIPGNTMAEKAKNPKAVNIVFLGVIAAMCDFIRDETAQSVIREKLGAKKPQFLESNLTAYKMGFDLGISLKQK